MKSKYIVVIDNLEMIKLLKKDGIINFAYPLASFCVGVKNTFEISEIKEDSAFLFVNRVMDTKSINELDIILHNLPGNIKGIIFDDLGLIEVTKDLNIEKILYNSHFCSNYESVNYMLDYVDTLIPSLDITYEETKEISAKALKPLSYITFGLLPAAYSRRTLLKSHAIHNNLDYQDKLEITNTNQKFMTIENEYGTYFYHYPYFNGTKLKTLEGKYYIYMPLFLNEEETLKCINDTFEGLETDEGFLNTKTIYKVKKGDK